MKNFISILIFLITSCVFSQDVIDYAQINSVGKNFTSRLKNGEIEYLKNAKPAKGTFTYNDLVAYKMDLKNNPEKIRYGTYIEKLNKENRFGYNLFAFKVEKDKTINYYFAAIVNIDTSNEKYNVDGSFLFTLEESLKSWWSHTFGFYHESNDNERAKIPKKYVYPICPPPPFRS